MSLGYVLGPLLWNVMYVIRLILFGEFRTLCRIMSNIRDPKNLRKKALARVIKHVGAEGLLYHLND